MSLTDWDWAAIEEFRTHIESLVEADDRYGPAERRDADDLSTMTTRFALGENGALECTVRPMVPELRVGFLTSDRWVSEAIEQTIEDSGDSMSEFVGLAFADAGLDFDEPPVEHYRSEGEDFYFATPIAIEEVYDLSLPKTRDKALRMLEGYLLAFGAFAQGDEDDGPIPDDD